MRPERRAVRRALACLFALAMPAAAAAVDGDKVVGDKPPRLLSEFGFFDALRAQTPAAGVLAFAPATPLFSDHAVKLRFVHVPAAKAAAFDAEEAFAFPVGSALIKTFGYPSVPGDRMSPLRLIETRVLARREDGWAASAYVWTEDQSDAELTIAGKSLDLVATTPEGEAVPVAYKVPNRNQCKGCHAVAGEIAPIGPKARNINFVFDYPDGPMNQLAKWAEAGILSGAPDPAGVPAIPDAVDETARLNERARAWLDINCAHCHRPDGPASNSGLYLGWTVEDRVALGIGKRPVAAGRASRGGTYDIDPGNPGESILLMRVRSTEPGVMMPELGRALPDDAGAALLAEWIAELK